MRKNLAKWHILLIVSIVNACLEFQDVSIAQSYSMNQNYPPIIDKRYISPSFTSLLDPVKVGEGCRGEINFKIPPLSDNNPEDRLHYLWFFDSILVSPPAVIESQGRDSAIISFTIKRNKLEELLGFKFGKRFFEQPHMVKFYVADRAYLIAENARLGKDALEDSIYWIVSFSDEPC